MATTTIVFDKFAFVQNLERHGFSRAQAEGIADTVTDIALAQGQGGLGSPLPGPSRRRSSPSAISLRVSRQRPLGTLALSYGVSM